MIKQVKKSKFKKTVAIYLAMMILLETFHPMTMYALTSGPTQPEFSAFTPIGTSDMVDLSSGDFNYNIPIMDVGGYPLNLAYNSGVTMDQEASWVGLGWNLNVGQIERQMRGLPDDFNGDEMVYENDLRDNNTVGMSFNFHPALYGVDGVNPSNVGLSVGLGVQYNNYDGISFKPTYGISYELAENVSVGANFSSSVGEGASVSPNVSISKKIKDKTTSAVTLTGAFGVNLSSRRGLEAMSLSATSKSYDKVSKWSKNLEKYVDAKQTTGGASVGGSISFNNQTFTPTKRIGFQNGSFTFDGAFGVELFGAEGQGQITGYGSYQSIREDYKNRKVKAFGYENTHYKNDQEGVLDFNREKEQTVTPSTNVLPITNYTYDIYSIEGQGVGGMFRPYRSQVSHVYNDNVTDYGTSGSVGVEVGGGGLFHGGVNFKVSPSTSTTGRWTDGNNVLPNFNESSNDENNILYEPYAYKLIGEMNVDKDDDYNSKLNASKALRIKLDGDRFNWKTSPTFQAHENGTLLSEDYNTSILNKIKRTKRMQRNQTVQKISCIEAIRNGYTIDPSIKINAYAKPHHTAAMKILQPNGNTYVYGETVYSIKKVEATFDVSGKSGSASTSINKKSETVDYNGDVRGNGTINSDHYVNKITTPEYAHAFLLTSVLSADYEDVDNNGPSDKDLGSYTKFVYVKTTENDQYKWRIPYLGNKASYNEGLKTDENDDKGNYLYGEKELKYLQKIETKTHIAFFDLEDRLDARGVIGESGGIGPGTMKYIKSIRLYAKSELVVDPISGIFLDPISSGTVKPIKTAHFEYDYSLCRNMPNNVGSHLFQNNTDINLNRGKLTLKKVYFTYRSSNMGKFTPYRFNYSASNPEYDMKANDIWGNYKPNDDTYLTTSEFPFVEQDQTKANEYTGAWALNSVELPSGGVITINTESDQYQYVQDKKAMQMFKVVGAGNSISSMNNSSDELYGSLQGGHADYIYVKLSDTNLGLTSDQVFDSYIAGLGKEFYFRFLLNMTSSKSDYVDGYFSINQGKGNYGAINNSTGTYAAIPLGTVHMGGGVEANKRVNPISKAGWSFGRTYLNRYVYSISGDGVNKDFSSIVKDLVKSIGMIEELFVGPNKLLEDNNCAQRFDSNRSWIRLTNADGRKYGGGLRVKSIELSDNWNVMTSNNSDNLYKQKYGQQYNYDLKDGTSSGVATYEPNDSHENPFVKPFYSPEGGFEDALASRKYVEEPLGENFFPSPMITYSRVTVSNLDRTNENGNKKLTKHATGKVVTVHYTSKDFPTIVNYTPLDLKYDQTKSNILSLLDIWSVNHITGSQGFSIETNDMNGKISEEMVYAEGQNTAISSVKYNYNVGLDGKLDNNLTTIDSEGKISNHLLGVTNDLITDFNESRTNSESFGVNANLAGFLAAIFPVLVPVPLPTYASHENILRTATTTKVVHKTGILIEKIATDLNSVVSTKNLAWDAGSGEILLTETINEYDDHYYSFNYPAYWKYEGMGLASNNIGIEGTFIDSPGGNFYNSNAYLKVKNENDLSKLFLVGDELILHVNNLFPLRAWVVGVDPTKTKVLLMDRFGDYINQCGVEDREFPFRLVRSGFRNMQTASMASVTSMINPIRESNGTFKAYIDASLFNYNGTGSNPRVINASAIVYKDYWRPQNELNLPSFPDYLAGATNAVTENGDAVYPYEQNGNPYLRNIKGEWKAEKSYAYLTGRNSATGQINNPRNEGFYSKFSPFYNLISGLWAINETDWTYASSVTQMSPIGAELENRDALNRYSSAQYGYNYTMPMAVASNAKYQEIGFEGFEETQKADNKHFGFKSAGNIPTISDAKSHSGKRSVKVTKDQSVLMIRKLKAANVPKVKVDGCHLIINDGNGLTLCYKTLPRTAAGNCSGPGGFYHTYYYVVKFQGFTFTDGFESHFKVTYYNDHTGVTFANDGFTVDTESFCGDHFLKLILLESLDDPDFKIKFYIEGGRDTETQDGNIRYETQPVTTQQEHLPVFPNCQN
ncbi:MAG: hypothetical protein V4548_08020 [Bacteroidota bacterium]